MENAGITLISLQRTPCFGTCPVDRVTFWSDGCAVYEGKQHVERLGLYEGRIATWDFHRLAELIQFANFFSLNHRYPDPLGVEDLPSRITSAMTNGVVKSVKTTDVSFIFEGVSYPVGLWAVEVATLDTSEAITWKPASPAKPKAGTGFTDAMWDEQLDR